MARRWMQRIGAGVLSLGATAGLLECVAALRVRRWRAERASLGDRLYTEIQGHGDPVVLLAGLPGTTRFWGRAFDPLAQTHRLIAIDALGFGRSPIPRAEYTLEDHLAALRRTLVALEATRQVTFLAHSTGALLAAHYAARHPAEATRLVLLGAPVFAGERDARAHIRHTSALGGLFVLNPILAREACKLHEAIPARLLARLVPVLLPDLRPEVARDGLLHTWRSFHGTLRHVVLSKPIATPLAAIGPRVTFVHGRADRITPLARVEALARETGARIVVTEDDHLSYPVRSADRIRAIVEAG